MRFDDRLKTVLAQRPAHAHDRAVRWRQLVELLARAGDPSSPLVEQALGEVRAEAGHVDEQLRAATARAVAGPQLPAHLVAIFAADTIAVAAPVLAAAELSPAEWSGVAEQASAESRRFLKSLHPDLAGEPAAAADAEPPAADEPTPPPPAPKPSATAEQQHIPSISEVLHRIERLRQEREAGARRAPRRQQRAGSAGSEGLFRWECGPSGEIAWVEGVPRGAMIGRSLANPGEHNGVDERIQRAFAVRAPFREAKLSISGEGVAAGDWKLSGVPAFEPSDGRFAGYRGVGTRAGQRARRGGERRALDNDSLRELVHELKTPLNAIIGFAEIIDGQYLGPADHSYRERAAEIVAQARLLLSAIEDLDLAAQLRSSPAQAAGSADLRELLAAASSELLERAGRRGASLLLDLPAEPVLCAVERSLAERMARRFCSALVDAASPGERLGLVLTSEGPRCLLSIDRPLALRPGEKPAAGGMETQRTAILATGVSLRLVGALARVAGGEIVESEDRATLSLPASSS